MPARSSTSRRFGPKTAAIVVTVAGAAVALLLVLHASPAWAQAAGARRPPGFLDIWLLPRVWIGGIFSLVGLALLVKSWVTRNVRLALLVVIFFVFGVLSVLPLGQFARGMSLHPSPVCIMTRPFQFLNAGRGIPILFIAIAAALAVLTIVGNKLFCGWACPIGAIQEVFHRVPLPRGMKIKLPFRITNAIRIILFVVFLGVVFTAGISIYDYFNPFHFLHWDFATIGTVAIVISLAASLFTFRPFCYLVCPLGLFTWVLEHLSLLRVKVRKDLCTECNVCVKKSPCPAVPAILEERRSRPDCHACGRCLEVCPEDALDFRM